MTLEDAYYFKILLRSGLNDGYDEWLDGHLEAEDPLSNIVLNLSLCLSDVNKTISCLHNYCSDHKFDEQHVREKLRLFLKGGYHSGRFSKDDVISYMCRFAQAYGGPGIFDMAQWGSMYYMDDYYALANNGLISWKAFDLAFHTYLNDGTPVNVDQLWNHDNKESKSLLKRIFGFLKKY